MCGFCDLIRISEMRYKHVNWKNTTSTVFCWSLKSHMSKLISRDRSATMWKATLEPSTSNRGVLRTERSVHGSRCYLTAITFKRLRHNTNQRDKAGHVLDSKIRF